MKAEKADVNSLILGIRMNFEPVCGKERTEEAVEMVKELQRLAAKGMRAEQAEMEIKEKISVCKEAMIAGIPTLKIQWMDGVLFAYIDCLYRL